MTPPSPDELLAQQALARQVEEALGEPKKKGKAKLVLAGLLAVLLIGAGVFGAKTMMVHHPLNPKDPPAGALVSLPQMTLNLADGSDLQVQLALRLSKPANAKTISTDQPLFANAEIAVFGQQTYSVLLTAQGKAAVLAALLSDFQSITGPADGVPQVLAVYYTDFVMQQA
jgi:flagellar basal body-associated protein FliL